MHIGYVRYGHDRSHDGMDVAQLVELCIEGRDGNGNYWRRSTMNMKIHQRPARDLLIAQVTNGSDRLSLPLAKWLWASLIATSLRRRRVANGTGVLKRRLQIHANHQNDSLLEVML